MSYKKLVFIALLSAMACYTLGQSLKIMTYNIRLETPADGPNGWPLRKAWLCEQIKQMHPDLFGIQEGLPQQVGYIDSSFSEYLHIGVGREDGVAKGEFSAIWYNINKIKLISQGTFWLSATPEKVSMGWDAACKRVCTYGCFQELASGKKFWMFNTHFDHIGVEARKKSAILILQKMKSLNKEGYPVILCGDLNATPDSEPIKILSAVLQDTKVADKSMSMGQGGTFNNFDTENPATDCIDYIFTDKGFRSTNYLILTESRDGRYASDHFPVVAMVEFKVE